MADVKPKEKTLALNGPVTITFDPQEIQLIVNGLKKFPYEAVAVVIDHIYEVCKPEAEPPA